MLSRDTSQEAKIHVPEVVSITSKLQCRARLKLFILNSASKFGEKAHHSLTCLIQGRDNKNSALASYNPSESTFVFHGSVGQLTSTSSIKELRKQVSRRKIIKQIL